MLLILEIGMTVAAFQKGWKWMALAPMAVALAAGVFLAGSGVNPQSLILADLGVIAVLGYMCAKPKTDAPIPAQSWGGQPQWSPPQQQYAPPQQQYAPPQQQYSPPQQQVWGGAVALAQPATLRACQRCGTPAQSGQGFCVGCGNPLS